MVTVQALGSQSPRFQPQMAPPCSSSVTLGTLLNLTEPQQPHLQMGLISKSGDL